MSEQPKTDRSPVALDRAVGETDVELAYLLLLGRHPESHDAVKRHIQAAPRMGALRERFFNAPEFYRNNMRMLAPHIVGAAYALPPPEVEDVVGADLERLFQHIQRSWTKLGETEPQYSVVSHPNYLPETFEKNRSSFENSGKREVDALIGRLSSLGITLEKTAVAMELGCGVGRVTRFLSPHFARVRGLDISRRHLALAEDYLRKHGIENCDLMHIREMSSIPVCEHDFFYSRIVLQHNPPPVAAHVLKICLSSLRLEGIGCFQLLTAMKGYRFGFSEYMTGEGKSDGQELHAIPQHWVFRILDEVGCIPLEVARDSSVSGFDRVSTSFIVRRVR